MEVPAHRRAPLQQVLELLWRAQRIVLTTHVNADGDGCGSEAALGGWLVREGKRVTVANPTPFPPLYRHLLAEELEVAEPGSARAEAALREADVVVVLDTGELKRLGRVARALEGKQVVVIDHHPPGDSEIGWLGIRDPTACATGELIYDLLLLVGDRAEPWPKGVVEGIYTAILTDTGSFRFANTTPRAHQIAADLMSRGVDPEAIYRQIFATFPLRRIRVLRAALEGLEVDPDLPISWITIPGRLVEELGASSEDLEGIVEYARSIEGTEVALLFRETNGATKVSFRSNGDLDVNELARQFGGGGHAKAAGALIGAPLERVREAVLNATRAAVRELERRSQGR